MADWYVFQHDGDHLGPLSTDAVAEAIASGKLTPEVWVAAPGGPRWLCALDVPVIARLLEDVPTARKRRHSGLRLMPGAYTSLDGEPVFGATAMIVTDEEIESAAETRKLPALHFAEDELPTNRALPPSSRSRAGA